MLCTLIVLKLETQTEQNHPYILQTGNRNVLRISLVSIFGINVKLRLYGIPILGARFHFLVVRADQKLPNRINVTAYSAATFEIRFPSPERQMYHTYKKMDIWHKVVAS